MRAEGLVVTRSAGTFVVMSFRARAGMVGAMFTGLLACGGDTVLPAGAGGATSSAATSGTTSSANGGAAQTGGLPCELVELFSQRCTPCHVDPPQFGAAMPLISREHLLATALDGSTRVVDEVVTRMSATSKSMPPAPNAPATAAEIKMVQDWIDAGTPERPATEMCGGGSGGAGGGMALDCVPDVSLVGASAFTMPKDSADEQICFGIELPSTGTKRHITALTPNVDNTTIIHHMLLMEAPTAVSTTPEPCSFTQPNWKLIYAWGPGTPPHVLPAEAGYPLEASTDTHFVLQVHYNNLNALEGETDQSGIDLCTTEELRPNDADIMAFGGTDLSLAANATTTTSCAINIPSLLSSYFPVTVFQAWPHMHQLGSALDSSVNGGSMLVDVPNYDFNYQNTYPLNVEVAAGQTITTNCTYQNTTPNTVGFGEDTADEMCFNFVSYYPRIEAPLWHFLALSQIAQCSNVVQ